jgi:hypothetical protein
MHPEAIIDAPLTGNKYLRKLNRILMHFMLIGIAVHIKDYDKEISPWRKEDRLTQRIGGPRLQKVGVSTPSQTPQPRVHSKAYLCICSFRSRNSYTTVSLWTAGTSTIRRYETTSSYSGELCQSDMRMGRTLCRPL